MTPIESLATLVKLARIGDLIEKNGCDCSGPCGCEDSGHDDDCERCLACRIREVIS